MSFYEIIVERERSKCNEIIANQKPLGCIHNVETRVISYGSDYRQYIRVFYPKDKAQIKHYIVSIHGGGLVAGEIAQNTNFCDWLAAMYGFVVFSVEYRLIPEVTFSQQVEDIVSAFSLIEKTLSDYTERPIYLTADSAGCHLALIANAVGREGSWFAKELNVRYSHNLIFDGVWFNAPMFETTGFNQIGIFMSDLWYGKGWKKKPMAFWLRHPEELYEFLPENVVLITSHGDSMKKQAIRAWRHIDTRHMGASIGFGLKEYEHDWNVLDPVRDGFTRDMNRWAIECLTGSEVSYL